MTTESTFTPEPVTLPPRPEFTIKHANIVSMDPAFGDMLDADIHIRNGQIVGVGRDLPIVGELIDASGMTVLPGLIDTHWHLWNSLLRGLVRDETGEDYFTVKRALGGKYELADFYWSARLALAEATKSGITTVHNWDHNVRSSADADLNIQAQLDSGLRGVFSYGPKDSCPEDELMDLEDLRRVVDFWDAQRTDGRINIGVAVRGPYRTPPQVYETEWAAARELGLPMTMHCDRCLREEGCKNCGLTRLGDLGLLGPDLQVVHAIHASTEDIAALAETGTRVSLSPITEMRSMGFPQLTELLEAGVPVSLSIDTTAFPTNADMFSQMRVLVATEAARTGSKIVSARRVMEMATIDGARDLGLDHLVGSISVGKRADLIFIRMSDLNLAPGKDPLELVVLAAQPSNVDTVIADGRLLMRGGELLATDTDALAATARACQDRLLAEAAG
ncbi:amidohydrolase family protein [Rhodococcus jostii]|uniref:Cytosine/adenosine deaminase n=1 Tax=Rhodococcus jostii TaxID=132919 RepID=A0A1H4IRY6_RHOJO|nr:amidohydrolase family protein [Rhodococcus jostii]SEB36753.1 Cytosine/adenosine deaminase [Rhodococcus jostii]